MIMKKVSFVAILSVCAFSALANSKLKQLSAKYSVEVIDKEHKRFDGHPAIAEKPSTLMNVGIKDAADKISNILSSGKSATQALTNFAFNKNGKSDKKNRCRNMTPKWSEIDPQMDPKIHPKRPRIDPKTEKGRKRRNGETVDRCKGTG